MLLVPHARILELTQMLKLQKVSNSGIRLLSWYLPSSLTKRKFPFEKKKHIHKCRCEIWKEMFCSEVTATLGLKCLRKALWPQLWILCSSRLTSWLGMWWRGYCYRSLRQIIEEQRLISLRHSNSWNSGSACSLMFAEFFNKHNLINPHNNLERKRNPST